ncbi:MAG: hypothetical protein ACREHG_11120, partial [Candidatus Saccharimonadales bacterium]
DNGRNVSELNHLTTPLAEARMTINTNPGNFRMPTLPGSLPVFPSLTRLDSDDDEGERKLEQEATAEVETTLNLVEQLRRNQPKLDKQERDEFLADGLAAELAMFDLKRDRERQEIIERSAKLADEMRAVRAASISRSRLATLIENERERERERERPVARQVRFTPTSTMASAAAASMPRRAGPDHEATATATATPTATTATPARFYPNVDPSFSVARIQPTLSAGVDLNALASLMQGRTLKAQAEKPQRFDGQPTIGLPTLSDKDGRRKQSLTEWLNSVDLYFALCGLTDERICFLFAMSLLEGAARTFMEAGVVKATPLTITNPDGTSGEVEPQTWAWLKAKLRLHYQPAQRNQLIRDQLRAWRQRPGESVSEYYSGFTYFSNQLGLDGDQLYSDFRAGLRFEHRKRLDEVMSVRRAVPGAPTSMTVEEALEWCVRAEMEEKYRMQAQLRQAGNAVASASAGAAGMPGRGGGGAGRGGFRSSWSSHNQNRFASLATMETEDKSTAASGSEKTEETAATGDHDELNAAAAVPGEPKRCWTCGEVGHFKRDCPKKSASGKGGKTSTGGSGAGKGVKGGNQGNA